MQHSPFFIRADVVGPSNSARGLVSTVFRSCNLNNERWTFGVSLSERQRKQQLNDKMESGIPKIKIGVSTRFTFKSKAFFLLFTPEGIIITCHRKRKGRFNNCKTRLSRVYKLEYLSKTS